MDRVDGVANDVIDQTKAATDRVVERVRENPMPAALLLGALGAGFVLLQARRGDDESDWQREFEQSNATGGSDSDRFGSDMG